jgi:hypothetical protein
MDLGKEECGMQILHSQGDMAAMYNISDKIRVNGYDLLLLEFVDVEVALRSMVAEMRSIS